MPKRPTSPAGVLLPPAALFALALLAVPAAGQSQFTPTGFQEYFVTGHEQHVYDMMFEVADSQGATDFDNEDDFSGFMNSVVGVVASADGQRIHYDQWEDGYDTGVDPDLGLFTPAQPTTLLLGDGEADNGLACWFTTDPRVYPCTGDEAHDDTVGAGMYLVFESNQGGLYPVLNVTDITRAGGTATVTVSGGHGLGDEEDVYIGGADQAAYNGWKVEIDYVDAARFRFAVTGTPTSPATGTIRMARVRNPTGPGTCTLGTPVPPQAGPPTTYHDIRNCSIPIPRAAGDVRYDGGDRIVTSGGPLSVAHVQDPISPYIADSMEMLSRQAVADAVSYSVPVGQDIYVNNTATEPFRRVFLDLVAFQDGTQVQIVSPGAGTVTVDLNRGQHYSSQGWIDTTASTAITINKGTKVSTTGPIFGMIYTGGPGNFATRHYALLPDLLHSNDYLIPAAGDTGELLNLYLLNPDPLNSISVTTTDSTGSCTNVIGPNDMRPYSDFTTDCAGGSRYVPNGSTVRLTSPSRFWGVSAYDHQDTGFDWGHSWLAKRFLTQSYTVSFSQGVINPAAVSATGASRSADYVDRGADPDCTIPPTAVGACDSMNRVPLFVSSAEDRTLVKVDLDNDGSYDYVDTDGDDCPDDGNAADDGTCEAAPHDGCAGVTYTSCVYRVDALAQLRVFDHTDYDNAGTRVVANKPVALAWGQDTDRASGSDPVLDAGYTVYPIQQAFLDPVLTIDKAASQTVVPLAGGTVSYTLTVKSYEFGPLASLVVSDLLPADFACTAYLTGSTLITYPDLSQGTTDPACAADPVLPARNRLTWALDPDPYALAGERTLRVRYSVTFPLATAPRTVTNRARASATYGGSAFNATDEDTVVQTDATLFKSSSDDGSLQPGDVIDFTLYARNVGAVAEADVVITDPIPDDTSYVAGSATFPDPPFSSATYDASQNAVVWTAGSLASLGGPTVGVNSLTSSGTTATAVTAAAHGWATGVPVTIAGAAQAEYNGTFTITVLSPTSFRYSLAGSATSPATGTITAQGPYVLTLQARVNPGVPSGTVIRNRGGYESTQTPYFLSNEALPVVVGPALDVAKSNPTRALAVLSITRAGTAATVTTSGNHYLVNGERVTIAGADETAYNGTFPVTVVNSTQFRYSVAGSPDTPATGTITGTVGALVGAGETITYDVAVRNTGAGPATNVQIEDTIPPGTTYITGSMSSSLNSGPFTVLTDASDADEGTLPVVLTVSSLTRSGSTATAVTAVAHGYATGQRVTISGANQPAYNGTFQVTATTSYQFTYTVTGAPTTPATGTITARRPRFLLPSLGAGQDVVFRFQVRVNAGATGYVNNQATVACSELASRDTNLVTNRITSGGGTGTLTGHVFLDLDNDGTQDAGEPNLANVDVVVTDSRGLTHVVTTDASGNYSIRLPAGGTTADVDESDPDLPAGVTLSAGSTDPQARTVTNGGTVPTNPVGYYLPRVTLTKTSDAVDHVVAPGDAITYTLTLTNNDSVTQTNVRIDDPLPAGTTFVSGSGRVSLPTFRVTEYLFDNTTNRCAGSEFTGTTCTFTLANDLMQDYFAIVQGYHNVTADTVPRDNYAAVTADPFATGGGTTAAPHLTASGATNRLTLSRATGAGGTWRGVVTVVECLGGCGPEPRQAATSITRAGTTATATVTGHGFATDDVVKVMGATPQAYNGTFPIVVTGANTFTYTMLEDPGASAGGAPSVSRISLRVLSITRSGGVATVTTSSAAHGYAIGDSVTISGAGPAEYNGTFTITATGAGTFTYPVAGSPASPATGTIQAERNPVDGFKLVDGRRLTHSGAGTPASSGTTSTQQAWNDLSRVVLVGGQNGGGCFVAESDRDNHQLCHVRYAPSGTNTIDWTRGAWGGDGTGRPDATSIAYVVQWGRNWTVNERDVSGTSGGAGANQATEYDNSSASPFAAVARANTWVFATGHTDQEDIGNSAEGTLVALGDGVNPSAYETFVAVGQEIAGQKRAEVWTMTHPDLAVDHRFLPSGNAGNAAVTVATAYAGSARLALVSNGTTSTANDWGVPLLAARYLNGTQIRLTRPRTGYNFTAWYQGVDFSGIHRASAQPMHDPASVSPSYIVDTTDGYSLAPGQSLVVTYQVLVPVDAADGTSVTNAATGTNSGGSSSASVTDTVRRAGVDVEHDNAGYAGAGGTYAFAHQVTNRGTRTDSFDLTSSSLLHWPVRLVDPTTGGVIAADLDGDGAWDGGATVNTGALAPGATTEYFLRATVPATGVSVGDQDRIALRATSVRSPIVWGVATDQLTVIADLNGSVQILPDNSGVVQPGGSKVYAHRVFNNTLRPDTFDLAAGSELGWASTFYWDTNEDGVYTDGVDLPITNTAEVASGGTQLVFLKVDCPSSPAPPVGTEDVAHLTATSRYDTNVFGAATDTTTVVEAGTHDLSGGGTRSVVPDTTTVHPGTLRSYLDVDTVFEFSIGEAALHGTGGDGLDHRTELWIDSSGGKAPDLLVATDTEGDGVFDVIPDPATYDNDGDGEIEVTVPAGGELAYELRRYVVPQQVVPRDAVTLTATSTTSSERDSVTATWVIAAATRAVLAGLRVERRGGVEWATAEQRGTRAFLVHATEDPTGRTGRRLLGRVAARRPSRSGVALYRLRAGPVPEAFLVLEELEVRGRTRTLGPFAVGDARLAEALDRARARALGRSRTATRPPRVEGRGAQRRPFTDGSVQGVKVLSRGTGEMAVPLSTLVAAGIPHADVFPLRVTTLGLDVPYSYADGPAGREIRFPVAPLGSDYAAENVYVVTDVTSGRPPEPASPLTASGDPLPPAPTTTRVWKALGYVADAPDDWDPWLWDGLVSGAGSWPYPDVDPTAGTFDLPDAAIPPAGDVAVRVRVNGYTGHLHLVTARLNGVLVGAEKIEGRSLGLIAGTVPASSLLDTGNQLTLEYEAQPIGDTPPDEVGGVFLDHVDLDVPTFSPRLDPVDVLPYRPALPDLSGVDYLVVTHPDFAAAAATVAAAKQAEGLRTLVVDTDTAYDAFSSGVPEAGAVRELVRRVAAAGAGSLRYVLLLGDDTFDNRDLLGTGARSYVPSLAYNDPVWGRVPSENRYADLDDDGLPDLAIGRLPAQTAEQAQAMADKVAHQAEWLSTWPHRALLAVDNSNEEDLDFPAEAREMAGLLPDLEHRWADLAAGAQPARDALEAAWAEGAAAVHYFGHGGPDIWADEQLLSTTRVEQLGDALKPAVVLNWSCSSGWFADIWGSAINEALLLVPQGGALAAFGPVGISAPAAQRMMYDSFYPEMYGQALGDAVVAAKRAAAAKHPAARDVIEGFALLGDPALTLVPPPDRAF